MGKEEEIQISDTEIVFSKVTENTANLEKEIVMQVQRILGLQTGKARKESLQGIL
jgi:hypothetical protein